MFKRIVYIEQTKNVINNKKKKLDSVNGAKERWKLQLTVSGICK